MFIGHFAVAFAALLAGIETVAIAPGVTAFTPLDFLHYPWSHSLLLSAVWALAFGALYFAARRRWLPAAVVALVVLSHWFLDLIVHRPDLPLAPGSDLKVGFGLWNSVTATLLVEGALFVAGMRFYLAGSPALDRVGHYALSGLLALLVVAYVGAALGYWIDRHRTLKA